MVLITHTHIDHIYALPSLLHQLWLMDRREPLVVLGNQVTIQKELAVMDATAFTMCMKSKISIFVFDIKDLEKLPEAIDGDYSFGTLIHC